MHRLRQDVPVESFEDRRVEKVWMTKAAASDAAAFGIGVEVPGIEPGSRKWHADDSTRRRMFV